MHPIYQVRQNVGGTYATAFQNGMVIPWKLLQLDEYIQLSRDRDRQLIPAPILENEIFKKCVVDEAYIHQLDFLPAGIVSTVVSNIWQYSGPTDITSFNNSLNYARYLLTADGIGIFHDLVQIVTIAFPYKPEEIYAMDYDTFMFRLAQAEKKLLQMGIYLQEPIALVDKNEGISKPEKKLGVIPENNKPDLKKMWEENQQARQTQANTPVQQPVNNPQEIDRKKWWDKSPVLETKPTHGINFNKEMQEQTVFGLEGHDQQDREINKIQFANRMKEVYADLLEELAKKKATK